MAAVLAAILAAATLLKLSKDYIQGQPLDIWDLLRPIILLTLVCLFRPMVLDPLDSIVNVFTRDAADAVSVSIGEYVKQWAENIGKMDAYTIQNSMQDAAKEIAEIAEDRSG
ncbi:MAG: hypothetical protein J6R75_05115, partial [Candidatus Methanomethylophilaceae archaeon]|nr:hypothetical protein [Candidatus Methanomethylophilaceae archaeon]